MSHQDRLADYLEFMIETAYLAGRLTLSYFQTGVKADFKADNSPVTIADRRSEELIRSRIERLYPQHAIVGEEYGFVGTIFIIGVFLLIMLRGIKIAKHARDDFGRLLALGITAAVTLYGLVNASVTLGVLPTTGLPMPFVSYGGSSMLFSAIAIGVLLNISSQTDMYPRLNSTPGGVRPLDQGQPAVGKVY